MTDVASDDPRLLTRGPWGLAILLLPIVGVIVMFAGYGVMWGLGLSGRAARGAQATLVFEGCPEARPFLEARLLDMGLDGTWSDVSGGFAVTAVLTGDADVDAHLPATLTAPGRLEIRGGDTVLATNADLRDASVRMDLFMIPYVLFRLQDDAALRVRDQIRADPGGTIRFVVDDEEVGWQSNQNPVAMGELEMNPAVNDNRGRMRAVAAWSVTLDHGPLPCPVAAR